jgi:hypothetical protein
MAGKVLAFRGTPSTVPGSTKRSLGSWLRDTGSWALDQFEIR